MDLPSNVLIIILSCSYHWLCDLEKKRLCYQRMGTFISGSLVISKLRDLNELNELDRITHARIMNEEPFKGLHLYFQSYSWSC